jgi:hypothetical protein
MKTRALDPSPFLSIPDAASIANLHPLTVYRMVRRGIIPSYGRPGSLRVKLIDILPAHKASITKQSIRATEMMRARWAAIQVAQSRRYTNGSSTTPDNARSRESSVANAEDTTTPPEKSEG